MHIPGAPGLGGAPGPAPVAPNKRWYVPYASIEDLRSAHIAQAGLGIINESDAWLTGRPYGLPGTTAITLHQRPGGYHSPQGHHYEASLRGAGFGDADATLQLILAQQQAQAVSLKRIAFWQALGGSLAVAGLVAGAIFGVANVFHDRHYTRKGR